MSMEVGLSERLTGSLRESTTHDAVRWPWLVMCTTFVSRLRLGRPTPRSCIPGSNGRGRAFCLWFLRRRHHQNPTPPRMRGRISPNTMPSAVAVDFALAAADAAAA